MWFFVATKPLPCRSTTRKALWQQLFNVDQNSWSSYYYSLILYNAFCHDSGYETNLPDELVVVSFLDKRQDRESPVRSKITSVLFLSSFLFVNVLSYGCGSGICQEGRPRDNTP